MTAGLEFRRLRPQMANSLAAFFRDLREGGDEKMFHPHPLTDEEANRIAAHCGRDLYYAAVDDLAILGYGMLRGWDHGFEVPSLGVALHPSVRGTGLAAAFMLFLHMAARQNGARRIRLKVYPSNTKALRLYESMGYDFASSEDGQLVGVIELR